MSNDNEEPGLKCSDNGCLRKCLTNKNVNFAIGIEKTHNQHKADTNKYTGAINNTEKKSKKILN